jgi:hypothetical protein
MEFTQSTFTAPSYIKKKERPSPTKYRLAVGGGTKTFQPNFGGGGIGGRQFSASNKAPGRPGTAVDSFGKNNKNMSLSRQLAATRPQSVASPKAGRKESPRKRTLRYKENGLFGSHKIATAGNAPEISDMHLNIVASRHYNNPLAASGY